MPTPLLLLIAAVVGAQEDPADVARRERALEQLVEAEQGIADLLPEIDSCNALPGTRAALEPGICGLDGPTQGRWAAALEASRAELVELDASWLPADRQLDARTLHGWVQARGLMLAARKPLQTDPLFYVEGIESSLRALVPSETKGIRLAEYAALLGRVEEIPAVLQSARAKLEWMPRAWADDASSALVGLIGFLAREGRELARLDTVGSEERARFEAANVAALEALRDFGSWLAERRSLTLRQPPVLPLGQYEALLESALGESRSVKDLELELLLAISERSLARVAVPEAEPASDVDALKELATRYVRAMVQAGVQAGAQAGKQLEGLPRANIELEVDVRTSATPTAPLTRLRRQGIDVWELTLEAPDKNWPAEARATRWQLLSSPALKVLALREGAIGATLLRSSAVSSLSLSRSRLPNGLREDGFGLYVAHRAVELSLVPPGDESYHAELARAELMEAARALAALELHAKHMSLDVVADRFATFTGFDRTSATQEASHAVRDPLRGASFLVLLQTLELEDEVAQGAQEEDPTASARVLRTLHVLLAAPTARIGDLRAR